MKFLNIHRSKSWRWGWSHPGISTSFWLWKVILKSGYCHSKTRQPYQSGLLGAGVAVNSLPWDSEVWLLWRQGQIGAKSVWSAKALVWLLKFQSCGFALKFKEQWRGPRTSYLSRLPKIPDPLRSSFPQISNSLSSASLVPLCLQLFFFLRVPLSQKKNTWQFCFLIQFKQLKYLYPNNWVAIGKKKSST